MPADLKSTLLKVAENALKQSGSQPSPQPQPKKPAISTGKAMLLGAGLATAGGALISSRGRDLVGSLRERIEEQTAGDRDEDDENFENEEYDEPQAEEDDDFDDEDDDDDEEYDEPEAEEDDDFEEDEEQAPEEGQRRRRARSAH